MSAIDPRRLKREAAEVARASRDPDELLPRCRRVLEAHAGRTRKPPGASRPEDAVRGFGAPEAVVNELSAAIDRELAGDRVARLAAVKTLWQAGYGETQRIAAELLGEMSEAAAVAQVETLLQRGINPLIAEPLVRRGTRGWREAEPRQFLRRAQQWLQSDEQALARAGLFALSASVDEVPDQELHRILTALSGQAERLRGTSQRAYRELLADLAARSAPECAQFLLDELRRSNYSRACREVVRDLLPHFDGPQRAKLAQALDVSR